MGKLKAIETMYIIQIVPLYTARIAQQFPAIWRAGDKVGILKQVFKVLIGLLSYA